MSNIEAGGISISQREELHGDSNTEVIRSQILTARIGDKECGNLTYNWDPEEGFWEIDMIQMNPGFEGRGIGKKLLNAFIARIGPGQTFHSFISHDRTVEALTQRYQEAGAHGEYRIEGEGLQSLPYVRAFQRNNVRVTAVSVVPSPEDSGNTPFSMEFWATTL